MRRPARNKFIALIKKYQQQKASPKEIEFIEQYYRHFENERKASSNLSPKEKEWLENKLLKGIVSRIREVEQPPEAQRSRHSPVFYLQPWRTRGIAAAVLILLMLGAGLFALLNHPAGRASSKNRDFSKRFKNDVPPGGNRAVLTLADGSKINLDSAHTGTLSRQGNAKVLKFNGGLLAYRSPNAEPSTQITPVLYNTVTTPRGGQYQVVLADGSKVWLNAASSLHFPTSFTGQQRTVELTGEAYFEVATSISPKTGQKIPFKVKLNDMEVEVLGTHFNINAYNDESSIKTTLLEGSVKIAGANANAWLKPGQQSELDQAGMIRLVDHADVDQAVAWKNGLFQFRRADIGSIMRQLSRWYDLDISYGKNVDEKFYADISRNTNVSNVLKILETTGAVHFIVEGKKVMVEP